MFSGVSIMLFVFNVASEQYEVCLCWWGDLQTDWKIYQQAIEKIGLYSPNALVYVLVHKMDKIPTDQKKAVCLFSLRNL